MSRTIAGTLLRPDGEPVGGARIFLTAKQNEVASIISGMDAFFLTESNGSYNQVVVNGWYNVSVEYTLSTAVGPRRWNLGDIFVDSGSTVDLNTLLQVSEAATDPGIVTQIQQWYLEIMAAVPVVEAAKVSAQNSATAAAGSATAASGSATAAASSATAANSSATTASTSATTATNAATTATTAAGTATTKAGEASTSATNAQNSATAAAASAASVAGVVDAAEDARDAAIAAKNDAQSSASAAATSEGNAADSATAASGSAGTASTAAGAAVAAADTAIDKADEAADSATAAAGSAGAASTSAGAAASSATAAQGFRDEAESHKDAAAGSATAAANSATEASSSADDAATARSGAESAETKAEAWAINPVDTDVEPGKFSALHWATKSEESAATSVANASQSADSAAEAVSAQSGAETARDAAALSATNASDSAVEAASEAGTAVTAREGAELARDDANTAQLAAEAAAGEAGLWENIAMQFAQNPEDVPVVDGDSNPIGFSALHWAAKAEESAGGGITPATPLSFLTDKQGAPFGSTSTMSQALQTLVDGGIGGVNTFPETLGTAASFEDFWAIPQGKPYMVEGLGAVATYLNSLTSSQTPSYGIGNANSRDVLVKVGSMQWVVAGVTYRKIMFSCKNQSAVNNNLGLTMSLGLSHRSSDGATQALLFQPAALSALAVNRSCAIDRNRPYVVASRDPKFDQYILAFQKISNTGATSAHGGFTLNADVPANSSINLFLSVAQPDIAVIDPDIAYFVPVNNFVGSNCVVFPVSTGAAGSSSISAEIVYYAQFISGNWQFSCTLKNTSGSALPAGGYIFNGGFLT